MATTKTKHNPSSHSWIIARKRMGIDGTVSYHQGNPENKKCNNGDKRSNGKKFTAETMWSKVNVVTWLRHRA